MKLTTIRRVITGTLAWIALACLPSGALRAQQPHVTRSDVNAEWHGILELEGGTHNLAFVFKLTDSTFAGTVYDGGQNFGEMERGTFSGDTVKFTIDRLAFTGVITGTRMKIALIVYNGSTRNFVATKVQGDKKG